MRRSRSPGGENSAGATTTAAVSAVLARNWWAIGLRSAAAAVFGIVVITSPQPTAASLILLFAAYVAADGACAILAGLWSARRGERSGMLVMEGTSNLFAAGAALIWPVVIVVPAYVGVASAWAIVSGAMMLAAARRLSVPHGRWILGAAACVSVAWGIVAAARGPSSSGDPGDVVLWLAVYAFAFAAVLFFLTLRLRHRQQEWIGAAHA